MDVDYNGDNGSSSNPGGSQQGNAGSGGGGGGDDDFDISNMLKQFSCMHTEDHESLVQQFTQIVGSKAEEMNPEFWLDMNNWNLQDALCSYFDYESQNANFIMRLPKMTFQTNTNFKEDLPPSYEFTYTTTVMNTGDESWPIGCSLRYCSGVQMAKSDRVMLPALSPGASASVQLTLTTPEIAGYYNTQYRPATITGQFFGEMVFIIVQVVDDLKLVTDQLSQAHLAEMETYNGPNGLVPIPSSVPGLTFDSLLRDNNVTANNVFADPINNQSPAYTNWLSGSSSNNNNNPGGDSLHRTSPAMPVTANDPATTNAPDGNDGDDSMV